MCLCVKVYFCICVSGMCLHVYLCLCVHMCMYVCVYLYMCVYVCFCVYVSVCPRVNVSRCKCVHVSRYTCIFGYMGIMCLCVYVYMCHYMYMFRRILCFAVAHGGVAMGVLRLVVRRTMVELQRVEEEERPKRTQSGPL